MKKIIGEKDSEIERITKNLNSLSVRRRDEIKSNINTGEEQTKEKEKTTEVTKEKEEADVEGKMAMNTIYQIVKNKKSSIEWGSM